MTIKTRTKKVLNVEELCRTVHGRMVDLMSHVINDYVPPTSAVFLTLLGISKRTCAMAVFVAQLVFLSCVTTTWKIQVYPTEDDHYYVPAVAMLITGLATSNKSGVVTHLIKLFGKALGISKKRKTPYHCAPHTFAGFRNNLELTDGKIALVADEIAPVIANIAEGTRGAMNAFNSCWSGNEFNAEYAEKAKSTLIKKPCTSLCGAVHPTDILDTCQSKSRGNGFLGRLLCVPLSINIPSPEDKEVAKESLQLKYPGWKYGDWAESVQQLADANPGKIVKFSPDAYVKGFCAFAKKHQKKEENVEDLAGSKREDNRVKIAFLIQLYWSTWESFINSVDRKAKFDFIISLDAWTAADKFVFKCEQYLNAFVQLENQPHANRNEVQAYSPLAAMLTFPGRVVLNSLLGETTRNKSDRPPPMEASVFKNLAEFLERCGLGTVLHDIQQTTRAGTRTGRTWDTAFVKAQTSQKVEQGLNQLGVDIAEYVDSLEADYPFFTKERRKDKENVLHQLHALAEQVDSSNTGTVQSRLEPAPIETEVSGPSVSQILHPRTLPRAKESLRSRIKRARSTSKTPTPSTPKTRTQPVRKRANQRS